MTAGGGVQLENYSFVVRMWREAIDDQGQPVAWRGSVDDVGNGHRCYFDSLDSLLLFIQDRIGVKVSIETQETSGGTP